MLCKFTLTALLLTAAAVCNLSRGAQPPVSEPVRLHFERAQTAMREGRLADAEREFHEVVRLDPKRPEGYANLGTLAYAQGRYHDAAQWFAQAVRLNPSLGDAEALLGMSQARMGRAEEGRRSLEKSWGRIRDKELRINVGTELIRIDQQQNRWEKASDVLRDLAATSANDPRVLYLSYRVYSELAAHAVAVLTRDAPDSAEMHRILAQAAGMQNDIPGAIAEYRKALQVDPHALGIHYQLGQAILASSQTDTARQEAKKEFEAELSANPADADAELGLAEVDSREGNTDAAAQHCRRSLQLRPDFADAHLAFAKLLSANGKDGEALMHLKEAERLDPDNEAAHYRLAQAYRASGKEHEADQELETVKKLRQSHLAPRPINEPQ